MKKKREIWAHLIIVFFMIIIIISFVSAGFLDRIKKTISGDATQTVQLNISVGGPQIVTVYNETIDVSSGPNEAPLMTSLLINFTAYTVSGAGNLNHSTALVNVSKSGEDVRENSSCQMYESSGNYANYTCNVTMWWWDGSGTWSITAYIQDNQTNSAINDSTSFHVGERTAFVMGPSALAWAGISSGATNQTSSNDPLLLNNTGNDVIDLDGLTINSSNLRGEIIPTEALWAGNFSVDIETGGSCTGASCLECDGATMDRGVYQPVTGANLTSGNYTINDGDTGQEQLYFCIKLAGSELSNQAYSTANETEWNWIVQIA